MKILLGLIILFLGYYLLNSTRSNESRHAIENNDSITIEKKDIPHNKNLALLVKEMNNLKQGTFEASKEYKKRHQIEMEAFQESTKLYAQKGLEEYSAGSATMQHYDPDTEIMELSLDWDDALVKVLPDLEQITNVYTFIERAKAKMLFEKQKKHFFHIKLAYDKENLQISQITIYGKYILHKNKDNAKVKIKTPVIIKPIIKKPIVKVPHIQKPKEVKTPCSNFYYCKTDALNVRKSPSAKAIKTAKIKYNEKVCINKKDKGWSHIEGSGWVLSKYLSKKKQEKPQKIIRKSSPYFWHCDAASNTVKTWAEHKNKQNAIDNALYNCDIQNRSRTQCRLLRCY